MTTPTAQPEPQPTTPVNIPEKTGWQQPHRWIILVSVIALAVIGLVLYRFNEADQAAEAKAQELVTALNDAGLNAPASIDTIARVLGTDGGAVCADPAAALSKAILDAQLTNGAAFVGQRPIRAEVKLLRGTEVVLQVYCPEQVEPFRAQVKDYLLDDIVNR
ncbi:MAG TPA: hypothetical protein VFV67_13500 [Actinophytocola sp.]|uniref:hypothetical protein n=1 Tax=Actinophytocola sp. TaxID=1872138 RepID=UPI002DBE66EE|nr:hypothetical protein [Actinophytocola sp.]HEU5471661.1 hypothetical protein [Actinophytocola sp.]